MGKLLVNKYHCAFTFITLSTQIKGYKDGVLIIIVESMVLLKCTKHSYSPQVSHNDILPCISKVEITIDYFCNAFSQNVTTILWLRTH